MLLKINDNQRLKNYTRIVKRYNFITYFAVFFNFFWKRV